MAISYERLPSNRSTIPFPNQITKDHENGMEVGHFTYLQGEYYAERKGLRFTSSLSDFIKGGYYLVSCGDVLVLLEPKDFPSIERRVI